MSDREAWAQLVSTTDILAEPISISKNKFSIGRSQGADLCLAGNKLVSGIHCCIVNTDTGYELNDSSTNGTLLNLHDKVSGKTTELKHGDEFHIVYRKNEPGLNVGYIFQDLKVLKTEEEDATLEYTSSIRIDDLSSAGDAHQTSSLAVNTKRPASHEDIDAEDEPDRKHPRVEESNDASGVQPVNEDKGQVVSTPDNGITKTEEKNMEECLEKDAIEETLICSICQEILYNCVSLQPCMHSFCAGCYSDWMLRSHECPTCRMVVDRINKNHIVNNLVEAYLVSHPDKKRPEEDLKELDNKNKITADMLKPAKLAKTDEDSSGLSDSDDYGDNSDDDDDDDDDVPRPAAPPVPPILFPATNWPAFGPIRPPKTVCRECPEYVEPGGTDNRGAVGSAMAAVGNVINKVMGRVAGTARADGDGAEATAAQVRPRFICAGNQVHTLCQCCLGPMPDRRTARTNNQAIPPQQCSLCFRTFCHLYWGCRKDGCLGCLTKFKEMKFSDFCLHQLVLDNQHESAILRTYMEGQGLSMADVLDHCLTQLDTGSYTCQDSLRQLTSNTVVCYPCALRNFKDLAYQYRKDIPTDSLPLAVTSRPNCHWGRNCRTQRTKPHHASNFNHICDQSKF